MRSDERGKWTWDIYSKGRGERQGWISDIYLRIRDLNASTEKEPRNILIKQLSNEVTFVYYKNLLNGTEYRRILDRILANEERKYEAMEKNAIYRRLAYNNSALDEIYTKVRCIYESYDFYYHNLSFNEKELEEAFTMFLDYVGLSGLYGDIKQNQMFLYGANKIKKNQKGLCLPDKELSYIVIGQIRSDRMEYYMNLIYEIALAYVNRVLYDSANKPINLGPSFYTMEKDTKINKLNFDEYKCFYYFFPPTFCRMFFDFLLEKKLFDITKINLMRANNEIVNYERLLEASEICSYIERKAQKVPDAKRYQEIIRHIGRDISPFIQQEVLGIIASCKLFLDYRDGKEEFIEDLPYIIKKTRKLALSKLLNTYCSCEPTDDMIPIKEVIDENLGRQYVKK